MAADHCDIAIIGAGAAGLAAAIFAGEAVRTFRQRDSDRFRIVLLDGVTKIGAKILVSGGGRCNVTHTSVTPNDFHGPRHLIRNVLAAFSERDCRRWFASLGVELKVEETGKLFPMSDDARTILEALRRRCEAVSVELLTGHRVADIEPTGPGTRFAVRHSYGSLEAHRVIMATGGRSLPRSGSDGYGWTILQRLGHTVTPTVPALVPLVLDDQFLHKQLMGLSQAAAVTTQVNGHIVDQRVGSLLWTHFGVSGPVVMDASRFWTLANQRGDQAEVRCNFLPDLTEQHVRQELLDRIAERPRLMMVHLLAQLFPERFAQGLCRFCQIDPAASAGQLRRPLRVALIQALTAMVLPVRAHRGWNVAEVTAGGVPLQETDFRTMESKVVPGLHLIGELLDCDGRIGGFNFQWAWSTGYVAGHAAAAALHGRRVRPRQFSGERLGRQGPAASAERQPTQRECHEPKRRGG